MSLVLYILQRLAMRHKFIVLSIAKDQPLPIIFPKANKDKTETIK